MLQENKTLTSLVLENYGPYTENLHVHVCEVNTVLATSDDANFNTLETDSTDSFSKLLLISSGAHFVLQYWLPEIMNFTYQLCPQRK